MFINTAVQQRGVVAFFAKWLRDLNAEQTLEHGVPMAVPNILGDSMVCIWQAHSVLNMQNAMLCPNCVI